MHWQRLDMVHLSAVKRIEDMILECRNWMFLDKKSTVSSRSNYGDGGNSRLFQRLPLPCRFNMPQRYNADYERQTFMVDLFFEDFLKSLFTYLYPFSKPQT